MKPRPTAGTNDRPRRQIRRVPAALFWAMAGLSLLMAGPVPSQDFVPFVIPAQVDPGHVVWSRDRQAISTDSERLITREAHFERAGRRVRIWGVNLSFGANFPTHEDAPQVAGRLAAAGVNSVRCHHMDTSRWPQGLWNAQDGRTIEPQALDRLDYFINELAGQGIYVNINLHVGRAHSEYLDLPKANREYDKIAGIFTPALIDAQKQFARELLTHVNPYRGVRYADDPAVAFVEVTNEDSLFMWDADNTLRTLPPYYAEILQGRFVRWLRERYQTDEALRVAWSRGTEPLGETMLQDGDFRQMDDAGNLPQHWNLERHAGCRASVSRTADAIRVEIDQADETAWHLQLTQSGLVLSEGRYYTVSFDAWSDGGREIGCSVGQAHDPWANMGLSRTLALSAERKRFRLGFVARANETNARVSFALSGDPAPVYVANVEVRPGGQVGLAEEESLADGSVHLFQENESRQRMLDRMMFLAETEKTYFDEMRRFIKSDLGCAALVTGTIVFGPLGLWAQSDMDFIDSHAYWQHPRFPGRPWDQGNWLIDQKPMTDYPNEATLFRIAAERLAGKPFTVSEYNHPAPLDAQAECVPMIASFAAAQDWDGIWFYTYSHSGDSWNRQTFSSFFDIDTNPAKWGFMRAGAAIFRDAAIVPLQPTRFVRIGDPSNELASLAGLHIQHDRNMLGILAKAAGITYTDMLKAMYVPSCNSKAIIGGVGGSQQSTLGWSVDSAGKGLYHAAGPNAQVYIGHAERIAKVTRGDIRISGPEFVALTVTPLGDAKRILITACGRCENTGMRFSEDRRTVGRNWGQAPVQIEAVRGSLVLPQGQWIGHALAPDGSPRQQMPISPGEGDRRILELSPAYATMWYLLEHKTN